MIEFRMRNQLPDDFMESIEGHMLEPGDISTLLVGECKVLKPNMEPLCVYLPGAISKAKRKVAMPILHDLQGSYTDNRGAASGSTWESSGRASGKGTRVRSRQVDSAIIGAKDGHGHKPFCRLTAWTGKETEKWEALLPTLADIGKLMRQHVPGRWEQQMSEAMQTHPEWIVPGTPFTTITVNNTYATGIHKDKGDLESGFSTLSVFRTGDYKGGWLCFPQYRLGVDMQDGDVLLMDAHEWHGNTPFDPEPVRSDTGRLAENPGFERISIVSYFRTNMVKCGTAADEAERAQVLADQRMGALVGE